MDMNSERLHVKYLVGVILLVIATYVVATCMQMIWLICMHSPLGCLFILSNNNAQIMYIFALYKLGI